MTISRIIQTPDEHALTDLTRRMRGCKSQYELQELWGNMNPTYHTPLAELKDELKLKLEAVVK